jgi:uncharacterized Zn finger protein
VATAIFEFVAAAWTSLLSNEAITQMVGHEAFARAMVAARGGHVHDVELDEQNLMVSGRVKGTYRDDYAVRVYLASSAPARSPRTAASAPARWSWTASTPPPC